MTSSGFGIADHDIADDTYNVSKVKAKDGATTIGTLDNSSYITDYRGNDTYTIDKLDSSLRICDYDGKNDTLIIKSAKADDLVFMAADDIYPYIISNALQDTNLYIYDKTNKGFLVINNYYKNNNLSRKNNDTSYGVIETMKAEKTTIGVTAEIANNIKEVYVSVMF